MQRDISILSGSEKYSEILVTGDRVEKSAFLFPSRDLGLQNVPKSA